MDTVFGPAGRGVSAFCNFGSRLIYFQGILDAARTYPNGDQWFNSQFTNSLLTGGANLIWTYRATGEAENHWIPGDWGYVRNNKWTGPNTVPLGLEGENIIYVGRDRFFGHLQPLPLVGAIGYWKQRVADWSDGLGSTVQSVRQYPSFGLRQTGATIYVVDWPKGW